MADGGAALRDDLAVAVAVHDGGGILGDLDLVRAAAGLDGGVLQIHAQLAGHDHAAGQGRDVGHHVLALVAVAGSLDADAVEGAAQLVQHEGGERVALDVLRDNEKGLAHLHDALEQGQHVLNVGDLLVIEQDEGLLKVGLHLVGIGDHVGAEIAAVKLHALDNLGIGLGSLALLNGDDAGLTDLIHGLGDHLADKLVAGGDGSDAGDVLAAGDGLAVGLDGLHGGLGGFLDAAAHDHRIRAGRPGS